jgi:hypothetical protein
MWIDMTSCEMFTYALAECKAYLKRVNNAGEQLQIQCTTVFNFSITSHLQVMNDRRLEHLPLARCILGLRLDLTGFNASCTFVDTLITFKSRCSGLCSLSRWRQHGLLKRRYPTRTLHGVTTQKTLICVITAVKTSNLLTL